MKKRTLSAQLYRYFFIVIILSLTSVGVASYVLSSRAIDEQVQLYMEQTINSTSAQTDIYLQTYELFSNSFSSNTDVRQFMEISRDDSYEYYYYSDVIKKFVQNSVNSIYNIYKQLNMVYVVGQHGRSVIYDNQNFSAVDPELVTEKFDYLMQSTPNNGRIVLLDMSIRPEDKGTVVTMARKVRGASYGESFRGVVAIEFKLDELYRVWQLVNLGNKGYFFIVDDEGNYIYHPDVHMKDTKMDPELANRILRTENKTVVESIGGENRLVLSRKSDYSKWNLVVAMPVDEMRKPVSFIRTTTLAVGLLTLIAALWLAAKFGRSIVAPIMELKDSMRETEKGNWQHIDEIGRTDEIGGLIHSYNLMVTRLSDMIERVYQAELQQQKHDLELHQTELERQRAEYQSLQLQINPHFLYNTLETINCYAIVQDSDEITEMVDAMAFMLRYSIQANLEEITVANELNHVRNFMIILQHRIDREFEIEVAIPPALLLEKMVRLTLQPIVENIFQHAFPDGIEPHHYIRIDAKKENGLFQVIIEDNGAGIRPERLQELRRRLQLNKLAEDHGGGPRRGGIGIMNVHRRIQMVFGEQYGLQIDSEWGQGSRITMVMPATPTPKIKTGQIKTAEGSL
ncbi:cache domain-containing sensor histidine kinase [Paenibacillus silviterrae]|uniref:cache domain-containing sensor histidine kinase n=1 Tax=Paenibacillus silviterrae TaxID=3242194 RepID=UPI00254344AD|nr:sensor histidine kinase [Paenibacillus chinjuensis]